MTPIELSSKTPHSTGGFAALWVSLYSKGSGALKTSRGVGVFSVRRAGRTFLPFSRQKCCVPALLCAVVGLFAFMATPAFAATEHGEHTPGTPFGKEGSGPGEFSGLAGVATDDATGEVYVVDSGNNRVERFSATGAYLGQFNGSGSYEVEGGKVETDLLTPPEPLSGPEGIAVDNDPSSPSYQDVYVADPSMSAIDKFGPTGDYKGQITGADGGNLANLKGIAVDPSGVLWIYRYNAEGEPNEEQNEIESYSGAEPSVFLSGQVLSIKHEPRGGIAVDASDDVYVVTGAGSVDELNNKGEILAENFCAQKSVSGLAVEASSNDLYIDSEGGTKVVRCSPSGEAIESETMPVTGGFRADTVAVNSSNGYVYATNATAHAVDVFPPFAGARIHEEQASSVEAVGATLEAVIAPNAYDTTYHFEYDTTPFTGSASHGTSTPDVEIQGGTSLVTIGARAKHLQASTVYYYRAVVESEVEGKTVTVDGPSESFTTPAPASGGGRGSESCANEQRRAEQPFGLELPDCRAYEIVSPVNTEGQSATEEAKASNARAAEAGAPAQPTAEPDAEDESGAVTYLTAGAFAGTSAQPTGSDAKNQYLSRREAGHDRWSTQAITPLHEPDVTEPEGSYTQDVFTPNLTRGIAVTTAVLTKGEGAYRTESIGSAERELGLYVARFPSEVGPATYRYITTKLNGAPLGASTDLSHVVAGGREVAELSEWVDGTTVPLSVNNSGEAMNEPAVAGWHGVSADGSRVYLSTEGQLYERVNAEQPQSPTVRPEASGNGTLKEGSEEVSSLTLAAGEAADEISAGSTEYDVVVTSGRFAVGQPVSGPGIEVGATITKINPPGIHDEPNSEVLVLSNPTTGRIERYTPISSKGPAPFVVGEQITGNGILPGTMITEAVEGKLTLSQPAASSGSEEALYGGGECTVPADACTVLVSAPQRLQANPAGTQTAHDQGASADGSKVFFTSNAELTEDAYTGPSGQGANLYEYELSGVPGKPGRLTDLTGEKLDDIGNGAAVQGVAQISEDGAYVYFVADGVLATGAQPGKPNLYVVHEDGAPRFIATLGAEDSAVWDTSPVATAAVVSPSGSYLAFLSKEKLKTVNFPEGYDNEQAQPGDCEGEISRDNGAEGKTGKCQEAYLYDAETGKLVCASCDPTGARPLGPANLGEPRKNTSLYRPRVLTADGTLFFGSYDALVTHASDGRQNVYEYERGQIDSISNVSGGDESFLLDTSASGGDVFFGSSDKLLPEDASNNVVVYDARIDGGFPVTVAAPPCTTAEACRTASPPTPAVFGAPPSATFSGPGNVPAPPTAVVKPKSTKKTVKCKKGFVKNKKGKCVKKPKKKKNKAKKSAHINRRASR